MVADKYSWKNRYDIILISCFAENFRTRIYSNRYTYIYRHTRGVYYYIIFLINILLKSRLLCFFPRISLLREPIYFVNTEKLLIIEY